MKTKLHILRPLAALVALLLIPASVHAQASILGSAGNFALLGGTAITSTGTIGTVISNGNVGLSPGPTVGITGFPPAVIVNGAIIPTGSVTAQARADLIKAQVGLAAMPATANLSSTDLSAQPLTPGVYKYNAAATLTGTLVLNAQGKNNVFWVFQIGTTLTTAAGAAVTIINPGSNGGSDYGIFWNCGSAINIAADNQIAGIYIAGTSLVFGVNSTRGGRALALAAISLDNNQIDARGGPGGGDWSGGLMFDQFGNVVPRPDATAASQQLSFRYFGKRHRITHTATRIVKGSATAAVTGIQWRVNATKWHTAAVRANGRWVVKARNLHLGKNNLRLRARNASGDTSAVQRLVITRL
jgi:hypothetical protein